MALKRWTFELTDGVSLVVTAPNGDTITLTPAGAASLGNYARVTDNEFQMQDVATGEWLYVYPENGQLVTNPNPPER